MHGIVCKYLKRDNSRDIYPEIPLVASIILEPLKHPKPLPEIHLQHIDNPLDHLPHDLECLIIPKPVPDHVHFVLDPVVVILLEHEHEFLVVGLPHELVRGVGLDGLGEGEGRFLELVHDGVDDADVVVDLRLQLLVVYLLEKGQGGLVGFLLQQH